MPPAWRLFGKQFLVVGVKRDENQAPGGGGGGSA
jgi:hypothetical protein